MAARGRAKRAPTHDVPRFGHPVGAGLRAGPFVRHGVHHRRAGTEARPYDITPTNPNLSRCLEEHKGAYVRGVRGKRPSEKGTPPEGGGVPPLQISRHHNKTRE